MIGLILAFAMSTAAQALTLPCHLDGFTLTLVFNNTDDPAVIDSMTLADQGKVLEKFSNVEGEVLDKRDNGDTIYKYPLGSRHITEFYGVYGTYPDWHFVTKIDGRPFSMFRCWEEPPRKP